MGQGQGLPQQGEGCWDTPSRSLTPLLNLAAFRVSLKATPKALLLLSTAGVAVNEILLPDYSQDMALN